MNELQIRQSFVETAKSYLGATKGSAKHHEIVDIYNTIKPLPVGYKLKYSDDWCAGFVSAMAAKEELLDIIPAECGCGRMITNMQNKGIWQESDAYVPQPGDILFYDWQDNGAGDNKSSPDHVSIVCECSDGLITTIEGNISGGKVGYRTTAVNGRYIRGFGVPNFKNKATEATPQTPQKVTPIKTGLPELKRGSSGAYVEAMQNALLYLGYTSLGEADGDFGAKTEKAVINFQKAKNLVPDGICGPVTWQAILKALPTLRRGMNNKAVKALQLVLKVRGFTDNSDESLKVDGSFGVKTEQATIKMQKAYGLEPDGICGPLTKAKF